VYVWNNSGLQKYDYVNNSFAPVSILGLNTTSTGGLFPMTSNNSRTEDKCLMLGQIANEIYSIDFSSSTPTFRRIPISGSFSVETFCYVYNGDDVYISNNIEAPSSIGSQTIPTLPPNYPPSGFIAKLNLLSDFTLKQGLGSLIAVEDPSFTVSVFPSPVTGSGIRLKIMKGDDENKSPYTVIVNDFMGKPILLTTKYVSNTLMNIASLKKGTYFIEIINQKGEKIAKSIIKL
jgi:hypothetical protein